MAPRTSAIVFLTALAALNTTACGMAVASSEHASEALVEAAEQEAEATLAAQHGPALITLQWSIIHADADGKIADAIVPGKRVDYQYFLAEGIGFASDVPHMLARAMVSASYAAAKASH